MKKKIVGNHLHSLGPFIKYVCSCISRDGQKRALLHTFLRVSVEGVKISSCYACALCELPLIIWIVVGFVADQTIRFNDYSPPSANSESFPTISNCNIVAVSLTDFSCFLQQHCDYRH